MPVWIADSGRVSYTTADHTNPSTARGSVSGNVEFHTEGSNLVPNNLFPPVTTLSPESDEGSTNDLIITW